MKLMLVFKSPFPFMFSILLIFKFNKDDIFLTLRKSNSPLVFSKLFTFVLLFSRFNINTLSAKSKSKKDPFLIVILNRLALLSFE